MLFLQSQTTNPYFNIAAEEYFLKNFDQDFFYLYINEPSIIIGKHQNAMAEINVPYVIESNLKVVRRLSGGGTVFHDLGNLNYCFIQKGKEGFLVDFKKYSQPVLDTLKKMGVNAYLRGKSDLVIDDLKFSGNAEHVYRKKVLHHGTMLFSSQLVALNEAIKTDWSKFEDKAVRSNRSKVANIIDYLETKITITEFVQKIKEEVLQNNIKEYYLTADDVNKINLLIQEKYDTWEWNFAYSPKYELKQNMSTPIGNVYVHLTIKKGRMENIDLKSENESEILLIIASKLIGCKHEYFEIIQLIESVLDENNKLPIGANELAKLFF